MIRRSLSAKILLFGLLNLLLLILVFAAFARLQLRLNLQSFLLAPARERIVSVSRLLALELPDTPQTLWNRLLEQYGRRYPAQFYLFDRTGRELAGAPVALPPAFLDALRKDPFAHPNGREPNGPPFRRDAGHRMPPPPDDPQQDPQSPIISRHGSWLSSRMGLDSSLALMRTANPTRYWVGVRIPIWREADREPIHATIVWQIRSLWTEPFFVDYRPWLAVVGALVVVTVICWLPLIRGLSRSVTHLTAATQQIANGHFEITLPITRRDEVGRLSESINQMAKRLSGLVYGQKRFLSDIAHELSSPLARMQFALGILEQRSTSETLPYVGDVREEVEHMSSLVSELLTFSKAQVTAEQKTLGPVRVASLAQRAVAREQTEGTIVELHADEECEAWADSDCLFRAVSNVLRNAIRYAGHAGPIRVSAQREGEQITIRVADSGPGVPEGELENLFRPFYRPEFARQRETGGAGLGLAIVRDCVEACGGTVQCRNLKPSGFEVEIDIPAVAASSTVLQA